MDLIENSIDKDFEIIIVDNVDFISREKQIELIGSVCHGYFESIWIENGKVEFIYKDNNQATELPKFRDFLDKKLNKSR